MDFVFAAGPFSHSLPGHFRTACRPLLPYCDRICLMPLPVQGKRKLDRRGRFFVALVVAVAAALLLALALYAHTAGGGYLSSRSMQASALKGYILGNEDAFEKIVQTEPYVVFLSLCGKSDRARVVAGTGATLKEAWDDADKKAGRIANEIRPEVAWVKADIVTSTQAIGAVDLQAEIIEEHYRFFYRRGVAFDDGFETAFLEAELNGNRIFRYYRDDEIMNGEVDYVTPAFNMDNLNKYLVSAGKEEIEEIPERIITFSAMGFFCGEDGQVHELYGDGPDYGRRVTGMVDDKLAQDIVCEASLFLARQIGPDGKFKYGHYPIFDNEMEGYNTIRHICATWSLLAHYYRLTGDETVLPSVNAAIGYMLSEFIEYGDDGVAWVIDRDSGEVRLGANAMAVVLLTEYMDLLDTDEYNGLVGCLADGIVRLQDPLDGSFYHVLNSDDFSRKEEFRIIYYDGEATFALARAYAFTKDEKYLAAAALSVERFIEDDYTVYTDHWIAYSLNEITKYKGEPRYYEFAMRNISNNLYQINNQETSYHTYLELLMAGWETYERILENDIRVDFPENFSTEYFARTIYKRARHMLNGYFYPEYAMYMQYPDTVAGSFFVRHHDFRVRIDDVQHFVGGYFGYIRYYEDIAPYLPDSFL